MQLSLTVIEIFADFAEKNMMLIIIIVGRASAQTGAIISGG